MNKIDQKEYLKRYLCSDEKLEKKKKKKSKDKHAKISKKTVKIIDDNATAFDQHEKIDDEGDLYALNEEAPQIVGIIDERAPSVIMKQEYMESGKWKSLDTSNTEKNSGKSRRDEEKLRKPRNTSYESPKRARKGSPQGEKSDESPPRRKNKRHSDESPPRRSNRRYSDESPPRKSKRRNSDESPPRKSNRRNSDESPPRRSNRRNSDESPHRRSNRRNSDESPPRKSNRKNSGESPPRRNNRRNSDESPPRKNNRSSDKSPRKINRRNSDESPPRKSNRKNSDESPPRKSYKRNSDESPPRRKNRIDSDESPPRRNNRKNSDESPHRRKNRKNSDESPPRRNNRRNSDESPPRRPISVKVEPKKERSNSRNRDSPPLRLLQSIKKERISSSPEIKREIKKERKSSSPHRSSNKMTKTLDGKASGLQNAKSLKEENEKFRARQDKLFREMNPDQSGKNADVVIRERKSRRNKDFEYDMEKEKRKMEAEEERKKEYDRWGKGLKQLEEMEKRREEYIHEASKPLARSEDDKDLQDYLKNQERMDDPMLQYMRRKKKEENKAKGIVEKPTYNGDFPDNRFNIRPGYRWDGKDRSNGYENKYFAMINSKKSMEEEAYRYSTEDM